MTSVISGHDSEKICREISEHKMEICKKTAGPRSGTHWI